MSVSHRRRHLYLLATTLAAIGIGTAVYRSSVLGFPLLPEESAPTWRVEGRISFLRHTPGPAKVRLRVPDDPVGFGMLSENFISRGYGVSIQDEGERRYALWAIRRTEGDQTLYYRTRIYLDPNANPPPPAPPFPEVPQLEEPHASALATIVSEVRRQSADVETFTGTLLRRMSNQDPSDNINLFLQDAKGPLGRAITAKLLLAGARVPARVLQTIPLPGAAQQVPVVPWLAVHNGDRWLYFDPATGEETMPQEQIIWSWDERPLLTVSGGTKETLEFRVSRSLESALSVAMQRGEASGSRMVQFSLLELPLHTQQVYRILVMVPIGVLIIVLMRNVVGLRTFGTFMPVLVAIAFRETKLLYGLILFSFVVGTGLSVRFYLERLHLLLVPRLATVLTVVVLLLASVSVLSHNLGIQTGLSVALFPMVIMAMVIERMSIVWEERGPAEAIKDGLGTLAVAALVYFVMGIDLLQHIAFVYPELLLVVLAMILLIGRYTGYRMTDIPRFKALVGTGR